MIVVVSDEVSFVVSQQLLQTVCAGPWEAGVRRAEGGRPLRVDADSTARGLLRGAGRATLGFILRMLL